MDNLILCTLMFLMLLLHVVWVSAVLHLTPCCITEEKIDTEVEHKDKFDTESIMSERSYEGEISCPRHTDLRQPVWDTSFVLICFIAYRLPVYILIL